MKKRYRQFYIVLFSRADNHMKAYYCLHW